MFCPKCATQNIDGASYCRVCGANISLVSQALTGHLPEATESTADVGYGRRRRKRNRDDEPPSLEKGIVNIFVGIGFLVAALAVMYRFPGGIFWGWCFFIPAFDRLGRGIASIVAAQKRQAAFAAPLDRSNTFDPQLQYNAPTPILTGSGGRNTGEMVPPPPSITEGTTRHLGAEAPTRHLDSSSESRK
jgi:hypothetical protein